MKSLPPRSKFFGAPIRDAKLSKYVERVRSERSGGFLWKNGRLVSVEKEPVAIVPHIPLRLFRILWADSEFWKMVACNADANWCLQNQGKVPENDIRYKAGQPRKLERAQIVEALVPLVKKSPQSSDGEIARNFWAIPFLRGDIKNLHSFAGKLNAHSDKVSDYLWKKLSPEVLELFSCYNEHSFFSDWEDDLLAAELNRIVQSGPIYDEQLFAGVELSKKTQQLLNRGQKGPELLRLNRMLLVDAYPNDLSTKEIATDTVRGLAKEARELAHFRDGVQVAFHRRK